jgi:hypothetical protein
VRVGGGDLREGERRVGKGMGYGRGGIQVSQKKNLLTSIKTHNFVLEEEANGEHTEKRIVDIPRGGDTFSDRPYSKGN